MARLRWKRRSPRRTAFGRAGTWGGRRPGSGRLPKDRRAGVSHGRREVFRRWEPLHVTLRVRPHVWDLRSERMMQVVRDAFVASNLKARIRIVHFSVQGNHIHLIVEASDQVALSRGMQGLGVRLARGFNRAMRDRGPVFADRYFARRLTTGVQARNALAYVLNNRRRHLAEKERPLPPHDWIDPYSSGAWFDGWRGRPPLPMPERPIVVVPRIQLLRCGWRVRGLIDVAFVPGRTAALGA